MAKQSKRVWQARDPDSHSCFEVVLFVRKEEANESPRLYGVRPGRHRLNLGTVRFDRSLLKEFIAAIIKPKYTPGGE